MSCSETSGGMRNDSRVARGCVVLTMLVAVGCGRDDGEPGGDLTRAQAALEADGGTSCSVTITGGDVVCIDCKERIGGAKGPPLLLKATGAPTGGTFTWTVADAARGKVDVKGQTDATANPNTAAVKPKQASENPMDVTVEVTYQVRGQTCHDTKKVTVSKPASLRLTNRYDFILNRGMVTRTKNGQPVEERDLPAEVRDSANRALAHCSTRTVGALELRYYDVLDQFGSLWPCDGELSETITPRSGVVTGGSPVHAGVVQRPDRIFECAVPSEFENRTFSQSLAVSGCGVGENTIEITSSGVTVTPR